MRQIALTTMILMLACRPGFAQDGPEQLREIERGETIARELRADETHGYRINLQAGEFLHAVIEQRGVDLIVALFGPEGKELVEVNTPNGSEGPEPLVWIAEQRGAYQLKVWSLNKDAAGGYDVKISEVRRSTKIDTKRVGAQQAFVEATSLIGQQNDEAKQELLKKYKEALALWREAGEVERQVLALNGIAGGYLALKNTAEALSYLHQALALVREGGNRGFEGGMLLLIAALYENLGDKRKALEYYNQMLSVARAIGDRDGEATALHQIGIFHFSLGEPEKALASYDQALTVERAIDDRQGEATTLLNVGVVHYTLGDMKKALEYYNKALPLIRATGNRADEATILNSIGLVYSALGEKQKALEYYNQTLPVFRAESDPEGQAATLNHIGGIYKDLGQSEKALELYKQAVPLMREALDRGGEAKILNNIGAVYSSMGEKHKALEYYNQALPIQKEIGDRAGEASTLNNIGVIYFSLNEKQKALDYFKQALPLRRAVGDRRGEAATLENLGLIFDVFGDEQKALENLSQALLIQRGIGHRGGEASTLSSLMLLWGEENPNLSIFYGKQSINVYQQLRGNITALDKELQESFKHSVEDNYRALADLLLEQGRLPEAQHVLGLLKEQEYFEFVRRDVEAAALSGAQINFSPAEAQLEKQFSQIAGQLAELGAERGALLALVSRTAEQEKRLTELETHLESANQAFQKFLDQLDDELKKSKPDKNDVSTLRETQALMDTLRELDAVALYTIVGQDKYRVILITADIQKAYEYPVKEVDLNKKVYALREVLQNPNVDPLPQAQELYRILIGPELAGDIAQTKIQTIMWSLDGTLRYLPIAALHDGQKYLAENYRNVVFTLASRDHLKDPVSPKWQALGLGVSREREVIDEESRASLRFVALPGVRDELDGIVRQPADGTAFNGVLEGKVMLDDSFTAEALRTSLRLRGGEQPYKLVHIASHFNFQPGDETKSFLLLGEGTLTLARLKSMSNLFSKVELLTLSACNTATGSSGEGKEVEGFAVLAQRQGAEAIIATLWSVSDPSTSQLMQQFYRLREAKDGTSKAEALRLAQLALLHGEAKASAGRKDSRAKLAGAGSNNSTGRLFSIDPKKPFAHPYYWAPFILIGNWK